MSYRLLKRRQSWPAAMAALVALMLPLPTAAGQSSEPHRVGMFVLAGYASSPEPGVRHGGVSVQAGVGGRVNETLALELLGAYRGFGEVLMSENYSSNFNDDAVLVALSAVMPQLTWTSASRFHPRPYLAIGAGVYWLHLRPRDGDLRYAAFGAPPPTSSHWRLGWSAAAGFRERPDAFGPRLEVRADVRRLESEVAGLFGSRRDWLRVYTASAGIQFP